MLPYKNLFDLTGKVIVITGSAGLLGSEFCRAFCELGAHVACLDIHEASLNQLVSELRHTYVNSRVMGYCCDVSDPRSVKEIVAQIIHHFNTIDILLNNAATKTDNLDDFFMPFSDYSLETWRKVMAVNLDAMFLMAQNVGHYMVEKQSGNIIQISSIYGLLAPDFRIYKHATFMGKPMDSPAVYSASKAGVIGLTKHLATLWANHGIRVNALCPGGVSSDQQGDFYKQYSARIPMGRMAETIDIVGPLLFLASEASQYMTGQVLYADGGLSAW